MNSSISPRLRKFLARWCNVDVDPVGLAQELRDFPDPAFERWVKQEFGRAVVDHQLDPDDYYEITSAWFEDQEALDGWLRSLWDLWFPGAALPEANVDDQA
ncbi:hypothetical protein ACFFOM_13745 [Microlunatus capsulatus]|uniref:Uncharacterized protein n=1 Tax=Microlunatus capsulatus TaxID=99117 RepID=A0ABS4Z813_9ACTN|nr:hypothetical protein [Microlunatus capsulatus]MBP2417190.1 hypothetical protein [Microlunatus capsulatus]